VGGEWEKRGRKRISAAVEILIPLLEDKPLWGLKGEKSKKRKKKFDTLDVDQTIVRGGGVPNLSRNESKYSLIMAKIKNSRVGVCEGLKSGR